MEFKNVLSKIYQKYKLIYGEYSVLDDFNKFLSNINSISGVSSYSNIKLKTGPMILNLGDLHAWNQSDILWWLGNI